MLVPSTCKAVTHVLSTVSAALGVQAPAGTWALQLTGLVVALSVVPLPPGSVVAVALAWFVVGNVVALKVLAGPRQSPGGEFFGLPGPPEAPLEGFTLCVAAACDTGPPPPVVTRPRD